MTFDQIVSDVMDRLNLTSTTALDRIRIRVNDRYRRVTSSIGLLTSRREVQDVVLDPTAIDSTLPEATVTNMEKILRITTSDTNSGGITVVTEKMYDAITNILVIRAFPKAYAVKLVGPSQVTIVLDAYPEETFTLHVEGYEKAMVLEGSLEPFLPEDFHDILIEGTMSDELRKMEKPELAAIAEANYMQRLSDLRFFLAKSAYMDIVQGKDKPSSLWYRPWYSRTSIWN